MTAIPSSPSMPEVAVERLNVLLKGRETYLEFGSGGSTILAARSGVRRVISVESDANWLNDLIVKMREFDKVEKHLLLADIGQTGPWGHPVSEIDWKKWHLYPLIARDLCIKNGFSPDLVLIDGRFRVACFLATLLHVQPETTILFDDYIDRDHYHIVEQFVAPHSYHDRMAEFNAPPSLDRDLVWRTLLDYSINVH